MKSPEQMTKMKELVTKFHGRMWKQHQLEDRGELLPMPENEEIREFDRFVIENWDYSKETKQDDY